MADVPSELRYTKEHEWARTNDDGTIEIGITDYAQDALGAIVYVELPKEGDEVSKEDTFGVVESTKSVSDLYAPITGVVEEVNEAVIETPDLVNEDPYEEGWLVRIRPASPGELDELMSAEEYEEFIGELSDS